MSEVTPEKRLKELSGSCPLRVKPRIFSLSHVLTPTLAPRHDTWRQSTEGSCEAPDHIPLSLQREHRLHSNYPRGTFFWLFTQFEILTSRTKAKGLQDLYTEIVTNPAEWDQSGLLKVGRHIDPSGPQHNCPNGCNPNICKGGLQVHPRSIRTCC
jgi:hypothetical protein